MVCNSRCTLLLYSAEGATLVQSIPRIQNKVIKEAGCVIRRHLGSPEAAAQKMILVKSESILKILSPSNPQHSSWRTFSHWLVRQQCYRKVLLRKFSAGCHQTIQHLLISQLCLPSRYFELSTRPGVTLHVSLLSRSVMSCARRKTELCVLHLMFLLFCSEFPIRDQ